MKWILFPFLPAIAKAKKKSVVPLEYEWSVSIASAFLPKKKSHTKTSNDDK